MVKGGGTRRDGHPASQGVLLGEERRRLPRRDGGRSELGLLERPESASSLRKGEMVVFNNQLVVTCRIPLAVFLILRNPSLRPTLPASFGTLLRLSPQSDLLGGADQCHWSHSPCELLSGYTVAGMENMRHRSVKAIECTSPPLLALNH